MIVSRRGLRNHGVLLRGFYNEGPPRPTGQRPVPRRVSGQPRFFFHPQGTESGDDDTSHHIMALRDERARDCLREAREKKMQRGRVWCGCGPESTGRLDDPRSTR